MKKILYFLSAIVGFIILIVWELICCIWDMLKDTVMIMIEVTKDFWENIIEDLKRMK